MYIGQKMAIKRTTGNNDRSFVQILFTVHHIWFVIIGEDVLFAQPARGGGISSGRLEKFYKIEYVDAKTVELTSREDSFADVSTYRIMRFDFDNVPDDQVFDLINEDTTLYTWKFTVAEFRWAACRLPMVIGDFDHNGYTDHRRII